MNKKNKLLNGMKFMFNCKDYSYTGDEYKLYKNNNLDLLITQPFPKDIEKYYESDNYISHTDSKTSFIDRIYQIIKKNALKRKLKLINKESFNKNSLLDIGSGTGDFLIKCKKNGWNIDGIEPSKRARKISLKKGAIVYKNINQIKKNKYDVITMWHVIEHIPNLTEYITKLKLLLKKDGVLIISVPNHKSYDAYFYKNFWAAYDIPRHLWHFSIKSISIIFSCQNMKVTKIKPLLFDSFYVSFLSEKYLKNKFFFLRGFFIGLISNIYAIKTGEFSSLIYVIKKKS